MVADIKVLSKVIHLTLHSMHISTWEVSSMGNKVPDLEMFQRILDRHQIKFRNHQGPTYIEKFGAFCTRVISNLLSFPPPPRIFTLTLP